MKSKRAPSLDLETIIPLLINIWRRFHKESGPPDKLQTREFRRVVECVKKLHALHDGKESLLGKDYFADREMLGAYLLYQWVVSYQQAMSLLGELPRSPKRVLDLCSGSAPFAFAALRHGANEVYAVDRNLTALDLGAQVSGRYGMPLTIRRSDIMKDPLPVEGQFDLITLGHGLNELFPDTFKGWRENQQKFIDMLLRRLKPHGYLMLVEGSFPADNNRLLSLRDQLVHQNIPIQAPCVWKGECPALKSAGSPCYAQREMQKPYLLKELQRAAEINLSSLKMSYLIVRSPEASWPNLPNRDLYRVISPPVETYKGKRYYLCGTNGKKTLGSHLSVQTKESKAFDFLKRGELISLGAPLEQQGALEIVEGTSVNVEAACGKSIPEIEVTADE
jgi:SAM-dependent methyltransferase